MKRDRPPMSRARAGFGRRGPGQALYKYVYVCIYIYIMHVEYIHVRKG
jgi:hypothetical protein